MACCGNVRRISGTIYDNVPTAMANRLRVIEERSGMPVAMDKEVANGKVSAASAADGRRHMEDVKRMSCW